MYNTSYVFDRVGKQIGKHRKVHLFDIDIRGRQTFKESDTLTAGDSETVLIQNLAKWALCSVLIFAFRNYPE